MNFASFSADGQSFYGAVAEGGMVALNSVCPQWPTLLDVIEAGALAELEKVA